MKGGWATGGQGEGIWAAGGMASDGTGVIAATGNRTGGGSSTHQDSEQVTRITGMGTRADTWYPTRWMAMDTADADVGSVNPVYVELPGATPSKMILQVAKDGHLYILDAAALGGSAAPEGRLRVRGVGHVDPRHADRLQDGHGPVLRRQHHRAARTCARAASPGARSWR